MRSRISAPAGIGPRDITNYPYGYGTGDALGGTLYWGASFEVQYPLYLVPKDSGFTGAFLVNTVSGLQRGETQNASTGEINGLVNSSGGSFVCQCGMQYVDDMSVRMSVGASMVNSPFGPLRFDLAYPILSKWYDRTQFFAFGGGTHF